MKQVRAYLSKIGRNGGKRSRRVLTPEQARDMVRLREARRAFKRFGTQCFWSFDPDYKITLKDLDWVVRQLRQNGGHEAWEIAGRLCR